MNTKILQAALQGLELQKSQLIAEIDTQISEINRMLTGRVKRGPVRALKSDSNSQLPWTRSVTPGLTPARRPMSPDAKDRIRAGQAKRWEAYRAKQAKAARTAKREKAHKTETAVA